MTERPLDRQPSDKNTRSINYLTEHAERLVGLVAAFLGISGWQLGTIAGVTLFVACLLIPVAAAEARDRVRRRAPRRRRAQDKGRSRG